MQPEQNRHKYCMWLPIIFRAEFINVNDGPVRDGVQLTHLVTQHQQTLFISCLKTRLSPSCFLHNHSLFVLSQRFISFSCSLFSSIQMWRRPQQPNRIRANRLSLTAMTASFMDRPRGGRSVKRLPLFTFHRTEPAPRTEEAVIVQEGNRRRRRNRSVCVVVVKRRPESTDLQLGQTQLNPCFDCGVICEGVYFGCVGAGGRSSVCLLTNSLFISNSLLLLHRSLSSTTGQSGETH